MKALRDLIGTKVEPKPTEQELLQAKIDQKWAEMEPGLYRTEQGRHFIFDKYENLLNKGNIKPNIDDHSHYVVGPDTIHDYIPAEDLLGSNLVGISELRELWRGCVNLEDNVRPHNLENAALLYIKAFVMPALKNSLIADRLICQVIGGQICLVDVDLGLKQKIPFSVIDIDSYKMRYTARLILNLYFRGILAENELYAKEIDQKEYDEKYAKYFIDDRIAEIVKKQNEFKDYISNVFTYRSKLNHIFGEHGLVKFGPIDKIESFYLFTEVMEQYEDICPLGFKKQRICSDMDLYLTSWLNRD